MNTTEPTTSASPILNRLNRSELAANRAPGHIWLIADRCTLTARFAKRTQHTARLHLGTIAPTPVQKEPSQRLAPFSGADALVDTSSPALTRADEGVGPTDPICRQIFISFLTSARTCGIFFM